MPQVRVYTYKSRQYRTVRYNTVLYRTPLGQLQIRYRTCYVLITINIATFGIICQLLNIFSSLLLQLFIIHCRKFIRIIFHHIVHVKFLQIYAEHVAVRLPLFVARYPLSFPAKLYNNIT